MATIAELIVKIGGNNAGLTKSLDESQASIKKAFAVNPINELTNALNDSTKGLSGFVSKVGAISGAVAGGFGLGAIVNGAVASGESIYQLSTKMGITAAEAGQLNKVLSMTGSDTDSFATAMMRLDKSYSATGDSGDRTRSVLAAFGVSLTDSTGKLLPLNQQLAEMSKGYKLAEKNGLAQEFVMETLGAKGLGLVQTFKDYDEVITRASKKAPAFDPTEMHKLNLDMKALSAQAGMLGATFTGALVPVAQDVFPLLQSGMSVVSKAIFENKSQISSAVVTIVELTAAYKTFGAVTTIVASIGNAWSVASAQAIAASAETATATSSLTLAQERSISKMVSASNREYARMEAAAIKAATASAGSTEAAATVIAGEMKRISAEAVIAAEKIRTSMTAAFLGQAEAATASAAVVSEAFAAEGIAATGAGTKAIIAAEATTAATAETIIAQERLAAANVVTGNTAVVAGEKSVSAMGAMRIMAGNALEAVWALAGGWVGLTIAIGYALVKLNEYQTADREWRGKQAVLDDPFAPQEAKNQALATMNQISGNPVLPEGTTYGPEPPGGFIRKTPEITMPTIGNMGGTSGGKSADNEAAQVAKANADYEIDVQKNKAKLLLDLVKSEEDELDRQRKSGLNGIRSYWASRESEDSSGLATIKEYWDKKTELAKKGINAELAALQAEKTALETEMSATSDLSESIKLKKQILDLTTNITLKERELGEVVKKNADSMTSESVAYIEKRASLLKSVKESMKDTNASNVSQGLFGSAKGLNDIDNEKISRMKAVQEIVDSWANGVAKIKDEYGVVITDTVGISKWRATQEDMINAQILDKKKKYLESGEAFEANLAESKKYGNLSDYLAELNSERGALSQDLAGRQEMISAYYSVWKETHRTSMSYMAEGMTSFQSGLAGIFEDIGTNVKTAGDLMKSFGSMVLNILIKMQAQAAAASVTSSLFGGLFSSYSAGYTSNGVTYQGPTMANGNFLFKKASGGAIYGPGTGTSDSIMAMLSNGEYVIQASAVSQFGVGFFDSLNAGRMPAFATGGIVTGASLSSISRGYSSIGLSGGSPKIIFNITNNTDSEVTAENTSMSYDGENWVCDVVLNKISRSPTYARNVRAGLGV